MRAYHLGNDNSMLRHTFRQYCVTALRKRRGTLKARDWMTLILHPSPASYHMLDDSLQLP
jgi:hypothetical protein